MSEADGSTPLAWQPLTPSGVAAFASAPLRRLLLVQLVVALLAAGIVAWFVHRAWFPMIGEAIGRLPPQGEFRSGRLEWAGDSPARLAEGRFLALGVDLDHTGRLRSPAHLQVEFGRGDVNFYSLLGCARHAYPQEWAVAFSQTELVPWWGAWAPAILAITGGVVATGLLISWGCLATVYWVPVWLAGFFASRDLSFGGGWRLAGAALMPGALLLCLAICLYGWGVLDPVRLALAGAVHVAVGWVYVVLGVVSLPPHPAVAGTRKNPFA